MKYHHFLFSFLILLASCTESNKEQTTIIPQVQNADHMASYFDLSHFELYADSASLPASAVLIERLKEINYNVDSVFDFVEPIRQNSINLLIDSGIHENQEYYQLCIQTDFILVKAASYSGLMHGIHSLIQLIPQSQGTDDFKLSCVTIEDYPKFKWRGLLLDCSRHFMEVDFVKRYIDLLAYHKMNVLHWHLTEDQGWRIEIKQYPKLTEIGAWRKEKDGSSYGGYYTQEQIKDVVNYASLRGVTIVPEIELPGHSLAALASYPEYSCTGGPFEVETDWGVFKDIYCAGNDSTFSFLENVLDEVIELFPSEYIHIGGDESPKYRWEHCAKCQKRIVDEQLADEHELQAYFIQRIENYLKSKGRKLIGWDEILEGGLAQDATVQSWRGFDGAKKAAQLGHDAIVSPTSHAYFDYDLDAIDLEQVYAFTPIPQGLSTDETKHIIGGECNMWTERAPQHTVDSKVFPRILSMSEVLWTYPQNRNYPEFYSRVQKHYKRLDHLGVDYGLETTPLRFNSRYRDNNFEISLISGTPDLDLYYQIANNNSQKYDSTFAVEGSETINVWARKADKAYGDVLRFNLYKHKGLNAEIKDISKYDAAYKAKGDSTIIDGLRGTSNFRDGRWQGYFGKDFNTTIHFDQTKLIDTVVCSFYQYNLSWIFMPKSISVYTSMDGENYYKKAVFKPEIDAKTEGQFFKEFTLTFSEHQAKYIKFKAENFGKCPDWHPAAGSNSWLFIDEVRIY